MVALVLGVWNGFLVAVLGIQPIIATLVLMLAGRGVALLITDGFITTVNSAPLQVRRERLPRRAPVRVLHLGRRDRWSIALVERRTALGVLTEAVGINPEASRLAGVRSRGIIFGAYVASGLLAGIAGILYSSNIMAADANAAGDLHRALRDPRGRARRHLAHGRQVHASRAPSIGVLIIQTLESTILFLGVPSAQSPVFFAVVVIIVVLIQSPRVHRLARGLTRRLRSRRRRRSGSRRGGRRHDARPSTTPPATPRPPPRYATFLSRHASLMPTFAALAIFIAAARRRADLLRQLRHAAQHVGAAARQRLPADPGRRA